MTDLIRTDRALRDARTRARRASLAGSVPWLIRLDLERARLDWLAARRAKGEVPHA